MTGELLNAFFEVEDFDIVSIDEAMKNGFGWKYGPFELLDKIGPLFIKNIFIKSNKDIPTLLDKSVSPSAVN